MRGEGGLNRARRMSGGSGVDRVWRGVKGYERAQHGLGACGAQTDPLGGRGAYAGREPLVRPLPPLLPPIPPPSTHARASLRALHPSPPHARRASGARPA